MLGDMNLEETEREAGADCPKGPPDVCRWEEPYEDWSSVAAIDDVCLVRIE